MPRKTEILAEETAVSSPLRRSTRRTSVNSPAPTTLSAKALHTQNEPIETKGSKPKVALSQDKSGKSETVENKPATRGRRASTTKEEPEDKPEPVKTRSRRSSATIEPVAEEEPKPQTVTRRRRSSTAEDVIPNSEVAKPVRGRRSSASEKPVEEESVKKPRSRRNSAKDEEPKEEPVRRTTRSRRSSIDKTEELEVDDKKPTTRGRRSSMEKLESEPEAKVVKLTPVKSRRRPSITDNAVSLEPIEETDSELKTRNSTSPILKEPVISLTPLEEKLNLSVINESSFVEETPNEDEVVTLRRSRLNSIKTLEKLSSPKLSIDTDKETAMEESYPLDLDKNNSSENKIKAKSPRKIDFTNKEELSSGLESNIKDEHETNLDPKEEVLDICEEKTNILEEKDTEMEKCNISMGSDGSFKFYMNMSIPNSQNESTKVKEDDLNSSKSSNTSDKENVNANILSSPKKVTTEEQKQVLDSLVNSTSDKHPSHQEVLSVRISDVFQPKGKEYSFSEPMDIDECSSILEESTVKDVPAVSTPFTNQTLSYEEVAEKLVNKNLRKESLASSKDDSVDESFKLCLSQEEEDIEKTRSAEEQSMLSEEDSEIINCKKVISNDETEDCATHLNEQNIHEAAAIESPVKNIQEQAILNNTTDEVNVSSKEIDNLTHQTECNVLQPNVELRRSKSRSPQPQEEETVETSKEQNTEEVKTPEETINSSEIREEEADMNSALQTKTTTQNTSCQETTSLKHTQTENVGTENVPPNSAERIELRRSKSHSPQNSDKNQGRRSRSPSFICIEVDPLSKNNETGMRKSKSPQLSPNSEVKNDAKGRQSKSPQYTQKARKSKSPQPEQQSSKQEVGKEIARSVSPLLKQETKVSTTNQSEEETELPKGLVSPSIVIERVQMDQIDEISHEPDNKINSGLELQVPFNPTTSPSVQNLRIEDVEMEVKRRSKSPELQRESKDSGQGNESESPETSTLKKSYTPQENLEVKEPVRALPTEDSEEDSVKSGPSDDYDFEVPSDEEGERNRGVELEYDQSTFVSSFLTSSNGIPEMSTTTEVATTILVNKEVVYDAKESKMEKNVSEVVQDEVEKCDEESTPLIESDTSSQIENKLLDGSENADDESANQSTEKIGDEFRDEVQDSEDEKQEADVSPKEVENTAARERHSKKSDLTKSTESDKFVDSDNEELSDSGKKHPLNKTAFEIDPVKNNMVLEESENDERNLAKQDENEADVSTLKDKDLKEDDVKKDTDSDNVFKESVSTRRKSKPRKIKSSGLIDSIMKLKKSEESPMEESQKVEEEITSKKVAKKKSKRFMSEVSHLEESQDSQDKLKVRKRKSSEPIENITKPKKFKEPEESSMDESQDVEEEISHKKAAKKKKKKSKNVLSEVSQDFQEYYTEKLKKNKNKVTSPKNIAEDSPSEPSRFSRLDKYLSEKMAEMSNDEEYSSEEAEELEEPNDYVFTMAEEGEEDTPSEDSNAIIDEGELINSTDTEFSSTSDNDYDDNDSFICDDEEEQLLSGDEYDLGDEKPRKRKKSRIVQLDDYEDDDVIRIPRKEKVTPVSKKRSRIITVSDSSESDEDKVGLNKDIDPEKQIELVEESSDSSPEVICMEETNEELTKSPESQSATKRRLSSLTIHENIDIEEIKNSPLSGRITNVLESFCSTFDKGQISMNLSIECSTMDQEVPRNESEKKKSMKGKQLNLSKASSTTSASSIDVTSEEGESEEETSQTPQRKLSISMDGITSPEKKPKKRRLSKSMDGLEQTTSEKKKRKTNKNKKAEKNKANVSNKYLRLEDDLRTQSFGLINQLVTDVKNRPKRIIKPSTAMNGSWLTEVTNVKPSTTSFDREERDAYKAAKVHPKDFRKQMLTDPSRIRRVETKTLLKKKGVYL